MKRLSLALLLALVPAVLRAAEAPPVAETPAEAFGRMVDEVAKEVEALRGWTFRQPVQRELTTLAKFREFMERQIQKQYPGGRLERFQAQLKLVGLLPPDCDFRKTLTDLMENQAGGFYDWEAKTLYLIERPGAPYPPMIMRTMIAHELTHALDDQHVDLARLVAAARRSEDAGYAIASLVEGSATHLMTRYMISVQADALRDPAQAAKLMAELMTLMASELERSKPFLEAPPCFLTLLAPYTCGVQFLTRGTNPAAGAEGSDAEVANALVQACRNLPRSAEQILHPEKYWDPAQRDEPVEIDDAAVERLLAAPGRHVVHKDTLGQILATVLVWPKGARPNVLLAGTPQFWVNAAAAGWGGDRFYLLGEGATREAAEKELKSPRGLWITAWDTREDRDEFLAAYEKNTPLAGRASMKLEGLGAVFFFGFDAAEVEALKRRLEQSPPPLRRGDAKWSFSAPQAAEPPTQAPGSDLPR